MKATFKSLGLAFLVTLLGATATFAQSQRPYPEDDRLAAWCDDVVGVLQKASRQAQWLEGSGQFDGAKDRLVQGLNDALGSGRSYRGIRFLTYKSLQRGLQLAQELGQTGSNAHTIVHFLFDYYEFVEYVVENLDMPYYVPEYRCGYCGKHFDDEFEREFLKYAKEQLNTVLGSLASEDGNGFITPTGDERAYLKAMEMSTGYLASDLRESLHAYQYSCTVRTLQALSDDLAQFNQYGEGYGFPNDKVAIQESYHEASDALDTIDPDSSCHMRWRDRDRGRY